MPNKIFCDENITKAIVNKIKSLGFDTTSVRQEGIIGIQNGDLLELISTENCLFITFDKDFLNDQFNLDKGMVIIDIKPNKDEYTLPIIEKFLNLVIENKIIIDKRKIILNQEFLRNFK